MSESNLKPKFEQIIKDVRNDLQIIKKMSAILLSKVGDSAPSEDTGTWIMDVFTDKLYQIEEKMVQIFVDISDSSLQPGNTKSASSRLVERLHRLAFARLERELHDWKGGLAIEINEYMKWVEWDLTHLRQRLVQTGWNGVESITPLKYISLERRTYVTARDELIKAKMKVQSDPEDVMMHLRNAIDYSLKEKFGFAKIFPMKTFIEDAQKFGLPLPSYDLIYYVYDEGSERIHEGKIHTDFDRETAVKMVDSFIDNLQLMEVNEESIQEFKSLSKSVR